MKTEYLRTAKNSYMIVKDADFEFESYELEMVLQNDLKNLVPMQVLVADGKVEYWFDVTGMKTLEQELSVADADREMIKLLLESICSVKMELEEYLLDDKDIPYTMGMIFRNRTGNRIQFCYIPGYHCGDYPGIRKLFEELMQRLNHIDQEAVRMISVDSQNNQRENHPNAWKKGDINWNREYLTSEQITDTKRKEAGTDKRKAESKETKEGREKQETGWRSSFLRRGKRKKHTLDMDYYGPEKEEATAVVAESMPDFNAGETVCFSESSFHSIWELVYMGDGIEKNLVLDRFPYIIGKNSSLADGILLAQTVSRVHARILQENDTLFLEDHNSTNGTYLNGHLIPMNTRMPLQEGDRLIFATEEFVLKSKMVR